MAHGPALHSPSSLPSPSACTEDIRLVLAVMVPLFASRGGPEVLPRSFPVFSRCALTPVPLLSYRNMFPSNLIEASFQQVSSPVPTVAGAWDGAQLHVGLMSPSGGSSPPTAWTRAPSLPPASLPTLPAPRLLSGHPKAGGWVLVGARTHRDTPACPPLGNQHNVSSLGPRRGAGASQSAGLGEQRGGRQRARGRRGWSGRGGEASEGSGGAEGRRENEQAHGIGKASVKPPEEEGWGGEGTSLWGPQRLPSAAPGPCGDPIQKCHVSAQRSAALLEDGCAELCREQPQFPWAVSRFFSFHRPFTA